MSALEIEKIQEQLLDELEDDFAFNEFMYQFLKKYHQRNLQKNKKIYK